MVKSRLLVAIPAFNEAEALPLVVESLRKNPLVKSILVIDDGSHDATYRIAKDLNLHVIRHPYNMGVGAAMRTAFIYAERHDYDFVIQVDADGQHDDSSLVNFMSASASSDVIVGSRFLSKESFKVSKGRFLGMRILRFTIKYLSGVTISDSTSGYRLSNRKAIKLFAEYYPAEYLGDTVTSLIIASKYGLVVGEVPVLMHQRKGGEPSQNLLKSIFHFVRTIAILHLTWIQTVERKNMEISS